MGLISRVSSRTYRKKILTMTTGRNSKFIKLISNDDHEFYVERRATQVSGTLRAMLSGPGQFSEHDKNEIHFKGIPSHVLAKVVDYFNYKTKYTNSAREIPEFSVEPDMALEILMAANFLDC